jgi:hypothetical protein
VGSETQQIWNGKIDGLHSRELRKTSNWTEDEIWGLQDLRHLPQLAQSSSKEIGADCNNVSSIYGFTLSRILEQAGANIAAIHNFRDWWCHLYAGRSDAMQSQMIVLAYLGSQCTKLHSAFDVLNCAYHYLEFCISPDVISGRIRQRMCIKF